MRVERSAWNPAQRNRWPHGRAGYIRDALLWARAMTLGYAAAKFDQGGSLVIAVRMKQAGLVALVAAIVMFTNLGGPRLWDIDEPRNAGCAREMWLRGDWIVPTFNAELRTHKPVLLYWCMMAAYSVLGVGELAAR